ncbi:MAG: Cys-Gln thioester bond-forming surface protein [Clostridia bacterium]|nr:Cys-Gln thioester bond-forming surface protein [Clostridia bacterium]
MNFLVLVNSTYAAQFSESIKLEKIGDCGSLLKYKGVPVVTSYIAYDDRGIVYPAYCLNVNLPGVSEKGSYSVMTNQIVTDVGLWRRVINGYPYKTISELGCYTKEEAFTATKHAIYCYVHNVDINNYTPIGEAGERTLNAMKLILANAESSSESKLESTININKNTSDWNQDKLDEKYLSKTYEVSSNANYMNYNISIENVGEVKLPEGLKITDINNNEKNVFEKGEKFKVLIPISNLKSEGKYVLYVKAGMNTKPVLYGKAPSSGLQDYAITTLKYEDGEGTIQDNYIKNETKIIINKKDNDTKEPLKGVIFELLNGTKETIQNGLKTDENGQIIISNILPGKYYLRETNSLNGYTKEDKIVEIEIKFNEEFNITINNQKEIEIKKEVKTSEKKVEIKSENKKLPVTGM